MPRDIVSIPKDWENLPSTDTEIDEAALEDLENRGADYVDIKTIPNVREYGAEGDGSTDDSAAFTSAIADLPAGGASLYLPPGNYFLDPLTSTNAAINYNGPLQLIGAGVDVTTLSCSATTEGSAYTLINAKGGLLEISNLTLEGPTDMEGDQEVTAIKALDSANTEIVAKNVKFNRFSYGIRANASYTNLPEIRAYDCVFDGDSMGLAAGEASDLCVGIYAAGNYPVHVDGCRFKNLGSDTTLGTGLSHAISLYESTPAIITNSRFTGQVVGRYISWNGTMATPTDNYSLIRNCYFGSVQVISGVNGIQTMVDGFTLIHGCDFNITQGATDIDVKGSTKITNSVFRGTGILNTGQCVYLNDSGSDSQIIEVFNCTFKCDRDLGVYIGSDNSTVSVNACYFSNDLTDHVRILGTGNDVHISNSRFKVTSGDNSIRVTAGTHPRLRVNDCEINGGADGVEIGSGTTVTKLILRDNEFTGQSGSAVLKTGTVTTEDASGNTGYGAIAIGNAKGVVVHGSVASTARPSGYISVEWIGTANPTNALANDTWVDISL